MVKKNNYIIDFAGSIIIAAKSEKEALKIVHKDFSYLYAFEVQHIEKINDTK